jgi:hypothetical protein
MTRPEPQDLFARCESYPISTIAMLVRLPGDSVEETTTKLVVAASSGKLLASSPASADSVVSGAAMQSFLDRNPSYQPTEEAYDRYRLPLTPAG